MKIPNLTPRRIQRKGFTLVEIVIVLGIIALLAAFVIPKAGGAKDSARIQAADIQMKNLISNFEAFRLNAGFYPTTSQGFDALISKPSGSPQPRRWTQQIPSVPADPWGTAYDYRFPGKKNPSEPEIICAGKDRQMGTDDDMSSQDE